MDYKIKIDEFEGPLDLLLHLIKESNIDIYDIKISEITDQYLTYIKAMESLNLSIASEYLVMAAELIELKSRMLLPNSKGPDSDEEQEDPQEMLIQKLLDYKNYKDITKTFRELEQERGLIYTKLPTSLDEYKEEAQPQETHSLSILLDAFAKFVQRNEQQKPLHTKVATKEVSVSERMTSIRNILKKKVEITFEELFEEWNREYFVVTFLSILQMSKEQEIVIKQDTCFQTIYIKLKG